jgi:hypothetical protein
MHEGMGGGVGEEGIVGRDGIGAEVVKGYGMVLWFAQVHNLFQNLAQPPPTNFPPLLPHSSLPPPSRTPSPFQPTSPPRTPSPLPPPTPPPSVGIGGEKQRQPCRLHGKYPTRIMFACALLQNAWRYPPDSLNGFSDYTSLSQIICLL